MVVGTNSTRGKIMESEKISPSAGDYLKAIYLLSEEREEIRISDIASYLEIKAPSASEKLESLKRKGFVEHEKYGDVSLTKRGKKVAEKITNRHSDLKKLFRLLGVDKDHAETDACKIEHTVSRETMKRLRELLEFMEKRKEKGKWSESHNHFLNRENRSDHKVELKPIGIIHTPYKKDRDVPHQAYLSEEIGEVEVFKKYEDGLKDIEGFSHLILLYEFNRPIKRSEKENYLLESYGLTVTPYLDGESHGLFATRSPDRPNPIGISVVELLDCTKKVLRVKGVDMLDETPLLDIKPYVPKFDLRKNTKIGWLEGKL